MAYNPVLKNETDFWSQNKPTQSIGNFNQFSQTAQGYGGDYMNMVKSMNPGGLFGGGPQATYNKFGVGNYPSIMNPGTRQELGTWNSYLSGGLKNFIDENARRMAGTSAATSRFGPASAGAAGTAAQALQAGNRQIASEYGNNIKTGMGYMQNRADYLRGLMGDYLGAYGNTLGSLIGGSTGMMGLGLQGLQGASGAEQAWLAGAGGANSRDVLAANQLEQQRHQESLVREQQAIANEKQNQIDNLMRQMATMGQGWTKTAPGVDMSKINYAMLLSGMSPFSPYATRRA